MGKGWIFRVRPAVKGRRAIVGLESISREGTEYGKNMACWGNPQSLPMVACWVGEAWGVGGERGKEAAGVAGWALACCGHHGSTQDLLCG